MSSSKKYSKAPITEAIIDVRIAPKGAESLARLAEACLKFQGTYPERGDLEQSQFHFQINENESTQTRKGGKIGFAIRTPSHHRVVQMRLDGLTLSNLAPYEGWEALIDEFKKLWEAYSSAMLSEQIQRVAVRYVNRLDLPTPIRDFKDYLLTVPEVAPGVSQALSGYMMQLYVPQVDLQAMLVINEMLLPPENAKSIPIVLDFDLFRENNIGSDFWGILAKFHDRKNEVFEACITDKTRELIR